MENGDDDLGRGFEKGTYGFSRDDLETMGERAVREKLNRGEYGPEGHKIHTFVSAWLKDRAFVAAEEARAVAKASALSATVAASEAVRAGDTARKAKAATIVIGAITIVVAVIALWPKK